MRIAIVAHALRAAGGLSIGKNMIAAMCRVAPENRYLLTVPGGAGYEDICAGFPNGQTSLCQNPGNHLARFRYELFGLPKLVETFRPDVILALGNKGLTRIKCPQAVLCHNSYLFYPKKHFGKDAVRRRMFRTLPLVSSQRFCLSRSLRWTQLLICQTHAAVERARKFYKYSGRTLVCPNAVSEFIPKSREHVPIPLVLAPFSERMKLFYLTRYYTHKNLEALVEVFRKFRSSLKDVVAIITISKEQEPGAARLLRSIEKHHLQDRIINVGPLKQAELEGYFRHCQALLMPTLLESFSGSYLEAMHFGLPILASNLDFAHAVCGDAALYFDPWDPASIRDAILTIKNNPEIASQLVSKGKRQLDTFYYRSWDEIVTELLGELRKICVA
ncbi:MAG: glycosyltransferase [Planctomycetota bacterium]